MFFKNYRKNKSDISLRDLINLKILKDSDKVGQKIMIACFPKSGSTFISKVLASLNNYEYKYFFDIHNAPSEQNLSEILMFDNYEKKLVIHQHFLGTVESINILNKFNIRPVVCLRNIYDCLVSIKDHMHKEGKDWPFLFHAENDFFNWNEEKQLDFIIQFACPWYITFYVSWMSAIKNKLIDAHVIFYEDLLNDKSSEIGKIQSFYNNNTNIEKIKSVIEQIEGDSSKTRFNKGVTNRGTTILNESQKQKIKEYTIFYNDEYDFKKIGIL